MEIARASTIVCTVLALLVSVIHFGFFLLESIFWGRPAINKIFGLSRETAEINRIFAFNQGFYNLFLTLGIWTGCYVAITHGDSSWMRIVDFAAACALLAGLVLFYSLPRARRGALLQAGPALLYLILRTL